MSLSTTAERSVMTAAGIVTITVTHGIASRVMPPWWSFWTAIALIAVGVIASAVMFWKAARPARPRHRGRGR